MAIFSLDSYIVTIQCNAAQVHFHEPCPMQSRVRYSKMTSGQIFTESSTIIVLDDDDTLGKGNPPGTSTITCTVLLWEKTFAKANYPQN